MANRDRTSFSSRPLTKPSLLLSFQELREWLRQGMIFQHLFHYSEAVLLVPRLGEIPKPCLTAVVLKLLSPGQSFLQDNEGRRQAITAGVLAKLWKNIVVDFCRKGPFLRTTSKEVARLLDQTGAESEKRLDLSGPPVYLLTDFGIAGARSGGSLGHIAGVFNNLENFCGRPIFLGVNVVSTVRPDRSQPPDCSGTPVLGLPRASQPLVQPGAGGGRGKAF